MKRPLSFIREFLRLEAASGVLLMVAAAAAMVCANGSLAEYYQGFLHLPLAFGLGGIGVSTTLAHGINDGLMAIFFLLVGMEIKREMIEGELATRAQALLPAVAALGGVMLPAAIYMLVTAEFPALHRGWAIPSATDIAFSLGVLALLGARVPLGLKIFLTAVAVIDDLAAILIIAIFYTDSLSFPALAAALAAAAGLALLNRLQVRALAAYWLLGGALWLAVLQSGVHATIAGVVLGLFIPLRLQNARGVSPLKTAEQALHPYVSYAILPVFAFANAGVSLDGLSVKSLLEPLPLGIALGLFFGKQIGIFSASWLMIRLKYAALPSGATWQQFYGVCMIAGIGFTMSLFIGTLAFDDELLRNEIRLGVMAGSIVSALAGYGFLRSALRGRTP